jgi:lipopolysaccharide export system permease protein
MQFLWKYVDDLIGKGISFDVILKLLFYISATLIPLALPLAILLSSIMTFGNLAESNELTALKASGLSLYKIMKPLTTVILLISLATFYFSNYIIPVAILKSESLIYDIQQTKISALITPGVFSDQIDGYSIKVDKGVDNKFEGILIHVHTDPSVIKTVRAQSGLIYQSENGKQIFFKLANGYVSEELAPQYPTFLPNGEILSNVSNAHPSRRVSFKSALYKINISGFKLNRSDEGLFKNQHEMMNVFQMQYAIDSIQKEADKMSTNFSMNIAHESLFTNARLFKGDTITKTDNISQIKPTENVIYVDSLNKEQKIAALSTIQSNITRINQNLQVQHDVMDVFDENIKLFYIGFHRKLALTFVIIVLFFIGAPLGAIIKKGGFGAPLVVAALLFLLYYVLLIMGQKLAEENMVSPFVGMWFASFILSPFALFLMTYAANDSQIIKMKSILRYFKRLSVKK